MYAILYWTETSMKIVWNLKLVCSNMQPKSSCYSNVTWVETWPTIFTVFKNLSKIMLSCNVVLAINFQSLSQSKKFNTKSKPTNVLYFNNLIASFGSIKVYEPGYEKMCLMSYANNKGADKPAHPRNLISTFDVRCLDSIISLDTIAKISRASVWLRRPVCVWPGRKLPKTHFVMSWLI